ncbi:MAG: hypothetical protein LBE38_04165 [Deltaproteobacteria bacterium]|jgi:hypothetical protein|nr:hypothetical protein [Deltaproteobacteria bacterium]
MRNSALALLFALSLSLVLAFGGSRNLVAAEDPGKVGEAAQFVIQIGLASQLAIEGRASESPIAIAAAAEILENVVIKQEALDKANEEARAADAANPDDPAPTASAPSNALKLDAAALFNEAAALATKQQNEALAGIFTQRANNVGSRQSTEFAIEHTDRVNPRTRDVYTHRFNGGELATVLVIAEGDYDIDLQIFDMNDNLIVEDVDYTSVGLCEWTPRSTGNYKIKVVNTTSHYVDYYLVSN